MRPFAYFWNIGISIILISIAGCKPESQSSNLFEMTGDVGGPALKGTSSWDATGRYVLTGGGANIWGTTDAFHFDSKRVSGDLRLIARIKWQSRGKNLHRKAGLMIRQNRGNDSPYADAVIHGDGLMSLQYRKTDKGPTEEIQSSIRGAQWIQLDRDGDTFSMSVSDDGKSFVPVGSVSVPLKDPVEAGLIVCSHDDTVTETAVFTKVQMQTLGQTEVEKRMVESTLEIFSIETGQRRVVYRSRTNFEAPNWSRDGKTLLFNQGGRLFTIPVAGGQPQQLDTGLANKCNNDHGYSPDGKQIVISHHTQLGSQIYTLPATGGTPKLITDKAPSYWHGWSPDGKTLAYCAERNGNFDIYTIPVEGGAETRLTEAEGLDDGPEYSPDGKFIYLNSERTGAMRIWRIDANGSNPTQLTNDAQYGDWFPHPSPDGKSIVFLSYDVSVKGHPANQDVCLRLMDTSGGKPKVLTQLFGGQGTVNVPSWSPDSQSFAFVSYRLVGP
jgi:TolB protein